MVSGESMASRLMSLFMVPTVDHFDILDVLGDPASLLVSGDSH